MILKSCWCSPYTLVPRIVTSGKSKFLTSVESIRSPAALEAAYGVLGLIGASSVTVPSHVP